MNIDKELVVDRLLGIQLYCECCGEEDLKHYIIDNFGSVFCNDNCLANSYEYRELPLRNLKIVKEV